MYTCKAWHKVSISTSFGAIFSHCCCELNISSCGLLYTVCSLSRKLERTVAPERFL